MAKLLSELLQSNRYRLLFLIYRSRRGRIPAVGTKSKLAKAFGYKSDGHFHYDWDYLTSNGLIVEEGRWVRITRKGKREFLPIETLRVGSLFSFMFGFLSLEFILLHYFSPQFEAVYFVLLDGVVLMALASFYLYVYRTLRPGLSDDEDMSVSNS